MANASQKTNFITNVRIQASKLLDSIEEMNSLKDEWDALMNSEIEDGDFLGSNSGLVTVEIANVIGTTLTTINTALASGHFTNLYKVKQ